MPRKPLPSPEQYGKTLAERRRKADRVPEIMKKLDTVVAGIAMQAENIQELPISAIQDALAGIKVDLQMLESLQGLQGLTDDDRRAIQAIEGMQETIIKALNALGDAIARMPRPAPAPKPTDLEPLMREIRGYRLDTATPVPDVAESVPMAYEFDSITRDENGDITSARVIPVTRH